MKKLSIFIAVFLIFARGVTEAQTPKIKWWYDLKDASFGQSAAGDIDADGKLEVVFGCYRNDSNVYALNANDGSLLWKYNTHPPGAEGCNDVAPVIYDVDNDTHLEVIVPSSCNAATFCFNGSTGALKWKCNTRGSDSPPAIADLDHDSKPEILHGEFGGYVICINAESGIKSWEIAVDTNSWIQTAPTIVDLDNNGRLDFVVGTWNFNHMDSIYAYTGDTHTKLWSYAIHNNMYHGTAIADLDQDGKPELLIGSYNDTLYCLNGENGTTKWKYFGSGGYIGAPVSIGDIDHDGICDIVFVSGYKVTALSNNGTLKWSYNIPGYGGAFRGVALADITNDAYLDIVFGTDQGKVIALNGNNGTLIWAIDLATHYGNTLFAFDHAPLIADFNNDDTMEVFIVGGHAEYPNFYKDFGRAYMISAGKGNGPNWLMFQHDIRRQSSLCNFGPKGIMEAPAANKYVITTSPNPSAFSTRIQFQNPKNRKHVISIYDSKGLLLKQLTGITESEINIEHALWKNGIYFFRIQNELEIVGQGKFVILK